MLRCKQFKNSIFPSITRLSTYEYKKTYYAPSEYHLVPASSAQSPSSSPSPVSARRCHSAHVRATSADCASSSTKACSSVDRDTQYLIPASDFISSRWSRGHHPSEAVKRKLKVR